MKYLAVCRPLFLLLCAASPLFAAESESADAADPVTPELSARREAVIESFDRIPLNTAPGDAMFLRILVESTGAKRGVEVGTATGYGAMFMGLAFERNGGHLTTIDIDPDMVAAARKNLADMKLEETVKVVEGDALEVLPTLEGEYDFVFIDAVKSDYLNYFQALEPRLVPGSVIVADNVIRSAGAMKDFLDFMKNSRNYHMVVIRASELKRDGMAVIYKLK
ncbi:MAG: class I SAM-dependent methyltransferase [Pirellulaceae bacterium]